MVILGSTQIPSRDEWLYRQILIPRENYNILRLRQTGIIIEKNSIHIIPDKKVLFWAQNRIHLQMDDSTGIY